MMEHYLHSPIYLRGIVLNSLITWTILLFNKNPTCFFNKLLGLCVLNAIILERSSFYKSSNAPPDDPMGPKHVVNM
jgi:hypothetical protein